MKENFKIMFSSNSNEWETPRKIFDILNKEFNFDLDACASDFNYKCKNYFTKENSCLDKSWKQYKSVFMNPPYGRQIKLFVEKTYKEYLNGSNVVMLIPARTDTQYFHKYIYGKAELIFIKGRLKFALDGISADSAPFPSMVCVYSHQSINCTYLKSLIN
jgi:site-specific DNA-methyltransferase (adenine-specific)